MNKPCPICGTAADQTRANISRPFCSERCRDRDLVRWLDGVYAIPGEPIDPEEVMRLGVGPGGPNPIEDAD